MINNFPHRVQYFMFGWERKANATLNTRAQKIFGENWWKVS